MRKHLQSTHPGEVLREEFLLPMKLTPYGVARACGVPRTRIERLACEETPVTSDTALRLSRHFGTTPQFWMGMQAQYDLERAEDEARAELKRIVPMKRDAARTTAEVRNMMPHDLLWSCEEAHQLSVSEHISASEY